MSAPDSRSTAPAHCSPTGPFLSEALDSVNSVRFSKFQPFERLMILSGNRFCCSSRTTKKGCDGHLQVFGFSMESTLAPHSSCGTNKVSNLASTCCEGEPGKGTP